MTTRHSLTPTVLVLAVLAASLFSAVPTVALPLAITDTGVVLSWKASADGSVVVYHTTDDALNTGKDLRAVRVQTRTDALIASDIPASVLRHYVISPNGAYAAFYKSQGGTTELWLAATDGSSSRLVVSASDTVLSGSTDNTFTPNGSHFLYTMTPTNASRALYSVATSGSTAPVQLNPSPIMTFEIGSYTPTPDSSRVIYTQILSNVNYALVNTYSVPVGGPGSSSVRLNQNGSSTIYYGDPVIAPNSQRVIITDQGFYSMNLIGGARAQLSPSAAVSALAVSADSNHIAYGWENGATLSGELYVAPIAGPMSAAVQVLSLPYIEFLGVSFSKDGTRVIAAVRFISSSQVKIFSTPRQGPASAAIELASGRPIFSGSPYNFTYWPGSAIAFQPPSSAQPFSVPSAGPSTASQSLASGEVGGSVTRDGERLVYLSGGQVYSVPVAGPISATRNESMLPFGGVSEFQIATDSQRLVFEAEDTLYSTVLGTGSLVASLLPECQSTPGAGGPIPTLDPAQTLRLYIPSLERCGGF